VQKFIVNEFNQNIKIDGAMGKKTISALNNIKDKDKLLKRITEIRKDYYTKLAYKSDGITKSKNYKFLKGWLMRVDKCLKIKL